MKKYIITTCILTTLIILSACTAHKTKTSESPETEGITAIPEDITTEPAGTETEPAGISVEPSEASENASAEGIWIKKYPGNYACFKFESSEGFQIVSDPFEINEKLQPDVVTESHQDLDHSDTTNLEEPYELITEPGEYQFGDVYIRGFAGKHNVASQEGSNNIYVISMDDITIAHFASQGERPSEELLDRIGPVDILLIQIFNNSDYRKLIMKDTDSIISKLQPKIIIPEHGDAAIGSQLAKYLNTKEEIEDSGCIYVTREMLDGMEGIRLINLDNKAEKE